MFDTSAEYVLPARSGKHRIEVTLRWPTDEEWAQRHRTRKILVRNVGRGVSESEVDSGEADLKLYREARVNGAPDLTAAEATLVVREMERADVTGVVLDGEEATVTMNVAGGSVKHQLQIPTADQIIRMQRSASRLFSAPYNTQQLRLYLEPTAKLWDECKGHSEDYTAAVPAIHKDAAIRAVVEQINLEMSAAEDEKFF